MSSRTSLAVESVRWRWRRGGGGGWYLCISLCFEGMGVWGWRNKDNNGTKTAYPWDDFLNICFLPVCLSSLLPLVQTWGSAEVSSPLARSSALPSPAPWWGDRRSLSWMNAPVPWTSTHRRLYVLSLVSHIYTIPVSVLTVWRFWTTLKEKARSLCMILVS